MGGVFTIPPDASFVEALARGLWKDAGGDPLKMSEMLVLLPTRRACRNLREAFLRISGEAMLLPRMRPLGDVDEEELFFSGGGLDIDIPPAIPDLRRRLLLTRLIMKKDESMPIDHAAQLAKALSDLIDRTKTERKDFSGLEKLVRGDLAEHWQETLEFLKIVTAEWPNILEEEGGIDPSDRRNLLLEAQRLIWEKTPPDFPVIAAGSTGSIPAVADLLKTVAGLPKGILVLPGLDKNLDEASWQEEGESHPQYGMKLLLELMNFKREKVREWPEAKSGNPARVRLLQEAMRPAETTELWREIKQSDIPREALKNFCRVETENAQEEAEVIALRLRAALEEKGKTAALVTPDRFLAARVSAALRRWGIEANDSAGTPLTMHPAGSFLLAVLRAASPNAAAADYLSLLKHPLAAAGKNPVECRRLARLAEKEIWRGPKISGGLRGAAEALKLGKTKPEICAELTAWFEELSEKLEGLEKIWDERRPLSERARLHIELAEAFADTGDKAGAEILWKGEDGEAAAMFFDDFLSAAKGFADLVGDEYSLLVAGLLREVSIHPAYGAHQRISVLGPLEARLHMADLIIIGGMNEGVWPPEISADLWMSRPMKRNFGIPLPERRVGLSAHDFVQLASAPEVVITRSRRSGDSVAVPSRFLLQTETVLQALGYHGEDKDALASDLPWADWARSIDRPDCFSPCLRPMPKPPAALRPKKLSVSDVKYWRCNPYALYAKRILRLKKLEEIDGDINNADFGNLVHEALEKFLRSNDKSPENLLNIGQMVFSRFAIYPQAAALWWPRFEKIAEWFVENEMERKQNKSRNLKTEITGKAEFRGGSFVLEGRADRVDKLSDGTVEIIDYKTGGVPSDKSMAAGYEPQLALLGAIAASGGFEGVEKTENIALSHWKLSGGKKESAEIPAKEPDKLIKAAKTGMEELLERYSRESTPYTAVPSPKHAPKFDDYVHLARTEEWAKEDEEE